MESYKLQLKAVECLITHAHNDNTQARTKIAQFFYGNRQHDMTTSVFYKTEYNVWKSIGNGFGFQVYMII